MKTLTVRSYECQRCGRTFRSTHKRCKRCGSFHTKAKKILPKKIDNDEGPRFLPSDTVTGAARLCVYCRLPAGFFTPWITDFPVGDEDQCVFFKLDGKTICRRCMNGEQWGMVEGLIAGI